MTFSNTIEATEILKKMGSKEIPNKRLNIHSMINI